jgi:hypothetical protein
VAGPRVLVYQDGRGWRYYWREGDDFAHLLRAQLSTNLALECQGLAEQATPPPGSIGTRWTPDLFDPERVQLVAVYDRGHLQWWT